MTTRPDAHLSPRAVAAARITIPCSVLLSCLLAAWTVSADPPAPPREVHLGSCGESIPDLYRRVSRAVVSVSAMSINPYDLIDRVERVAGSGLILDVSGLVLTNSHVVFGRQVISATLDDGTTLPAEIVGADPLFDIAVLRLSKLPSEPLPTAHLGDSGQLLVGEDVFAIGNPFGLDQTLTRGVVSAVNRILPGGSWSAREPLIQTDAAINLGSSGGPLVDRCGDVIGINTAILPDAQSIGFAIPVNLVKSVIPDLVTNGRVIRPWLGIQGLLVTRDLKRLLREPLADGFLVEVVESSSPAGGTGIRGGDLDLVISGQPVFIGGDVVTVMNGTSVASPEGLLGAFSGLKVGEMVHLTLVREGQAREVDLVVAERPLLPGDTSPRRTAAPMGDASRASAGRSRNVRMVL